MALRGDISELPIGEVLQLLIQTQRNGVLKIKSGDESRLFWLQVGRLTLFLTGSRKRFRIGDLLIRTGTVTEQELKEALDLQKSSGLRIGEILQQQGKVTEDELENILGRKFEEEIVELFMLDEGEFIFYFDDIPDNHLQSDKVVSQVSLGTDLLILEALRQIDEWQQTTKELPGFKTVFVFADDGDTRLAELDLRNSLRHQLRLVDGVRSIEMLIADTTVSKFEMLSLIFDLYKRAVIRPLAIDEARDLAAAYTKAGDFGAAKSCYDHALLLAPDNIEVRIEKFCLLRDRREFQPALHEARRIANAYRRLQRYPEAIKYIEQARAISPRDPDINAALFQLLAKTEQPDKAGKVGRALIELYQRRGEAHLAADVIQQLLRWQPHDTTLRLDYAEIRSAVEGREAALEEYDRCLRHVADGDTSGRIDVLRRIVRLDKSRDDARHELKTLLAEQRPHSTTTLRAFTRRRRGPLLIAVAAVILLLVGNQIWKEVSVRTALAETDERLARASSPMELNELIFEYRLLAKHYAWTTKGSEAEGRIVRTEARRRELLAQQPHVAEPPDPDPDPDPDPAPVPDPISDVQDWRAYLELRQSGSLEEAAQAASEFLERHAVSGYRARLETPVLLATQPSGASIYLEGKLVGRSPETLWVQVGVRHALEARLPGFGSQSVDLKGVGVERFELSLERVPLWQQDLQILPTGSAALSGRQWLISSREGWLAQLDLNEHSYTRQPLGLLGHEQYLSPHPDGAWGAAGNICMLYRRGRPLATMLAGSLSGASSDGQGGLLCALKSGKVLRLGPDARQIWSRELVGNPQGAAIAGSSQALLAARGSDGKGELLAFDLQDGKLLWHREISAQVCRVVAFFEGRWLVSSSSGLLLVDELGDSLWQVPLEGRLSAAPVLVDGSLVLSEAHRLSAIEFASGDVVWRKSGLDSVSASTAAEDCLYLGVGKQLWKLNLAGELLWKAELPCRVVCAPAVGHEVVVMTEDGVAHAFLP